MRGRIAHGWGTSAARAPTRSALQCASPEPGAPSVTRTWSRVGGTTTAPSRNLPGHPKYAKLLSRWTRTASSRFSAATPRNSRRRASPICASSAPSPAAKPHPSPTSTSWRVAHPQIYGWPIHALFSAGEWGTSKPVA